MFLLLSAAIFPLICVAPTLFLTAGRNGSMITFADADIIPAKYPDTRVAEFNSGSAGVFGIALSLIVMHECDHELVL